MNRPAIPLVIAGILTALAVLLALRMDLVTGLDTLLPDNRSSVIEQHRVAQKTAVGATLFVVLQGGPTTGTGALRDAGDALVPELAKLGAPWAGSVEDGVHDAHRFLKPRGGLYADTARLAALRDNIAARNTHEAPLDAAEVRETLGAGGADPARYPDGYYQSRDGKTLVVAIRSKVAETDVTSGAEALRRVREVVERVHPASFDAGITWAFAGDLRSAVAEHAAVRQDVTEVARLGILLIAGIVFLYYLRLRTVVAMLLTVGVGVAWTFAATELCIGHLNMATGFLFTVIAGNGINFGIIYMARFREARRRGATLLDGVRLAHRESWRSSITAGCAAGASYGALMITELRGFRDFGMIGCSGMVLCWIATYLTLPSILAVMERIWPLQRDAENGPVSARAALGKSLAALVPLAPRAVSITGAALAILGFAAAAVYVRGDPMEYDLKKLRNRERAGA